MRKTKIKSLIILSALLGCSIQSSVAQNTERRNMNQDSTSLVPSGMTTVPTNQTFTSTYSTVMGACGADNGKTLSSAPTNLCNTGTPSTVNTNGSSIVWSCTGNYGIASTSSCSAQLVDAKCGSDNGKRRMPGQNLCTLGTASSISVSSIGTGTGPVITSSWSCNGNYGASASCSATYTCRDLPMMSIYTGSCKNTSNR